MYNYLVYGFIIRSDIKLNLCDVKDSTGNLSIYLDCNFPPAIHSKLQISNKKVCVGDYWTAFQINQAVEFFIEDGTHIAYKIVNDIGSEYFTSLILGPCMGVILYSHGLLPLHASSISNGDNTIIIAGKSGTGKSTLTACFLQHKWRIINDDISPISFSTRLPVILPGYPKIRLWENNVSALNVVSNGIYKLYQKNGRTKYSVDIANCFEPYPQSPSLIAVLTSQCRACDSLMIQSERDKADVIFSILYRRNIGLAENLRTQILDMCYNLAVEVPLVLIPWDASTSDPQRKYDSIMRCL